MPEKMNLQVEMAATRTRFAAERTLMSWIRTAFSMITFGFTLLKFFQYLQSNNPNAPHVTGTRHLGIFLILLGIFCLIPGIIEHYKSLQMLHLTDGGPRWSYAFFMALLVGLIGIYALGNALAIKFF